MPAPVDEALTELDAVERGFVLGALLAGAADDPTFVGALRGASRERCGRTLQAVAALTREDRVRLTGLLAREARATWPAGIEDVHPDHLRAILDDESTAIVRLVEGNAPASLRAALAARLVAPHQPEWRDGAGPQARPEAPAAAEGVDPDLRREVQRSVFAGIAEVAPPWRDLAPGRWSRQVSLLAPTALLALVSACGAQVASAGEAPERAAQRGARTVGARLAHDNRLGLGAADEVMAVAQRLPRFLADALLAAAREGSPEISGATCHDGLQRSSAD